MSKLKPGAALPEAGEGKRGSQGHIAYLLRQANASVRLAIDAGLAQARLTSPQFLVLNLLDAYSGASGADVARLASLTPQTVNLIVRKLERDDLIKRSEHQTHGRVLNMALTTLGQQKLQQCKLLAQQTEEQILALLDDRSEATVRRWLSDVAVQLARSKTKTRKS
jgi:DNA-binding MarR family transcriptional regulator